MNNNIYDFSLQTVVLTWWSLFRDSSYYILSVLALIMVRCASYQTYPSVLTLHSATSCFKQTILSLFRLSMMLELSGESAYFLDILP